MELWIRSQDKTKLMRLNNLGTFFVRSEDYYAIYNDEHILGNYETEERTLEILDEIQDLLKPRNLIYTGSKLPIKDAMHLVKMTNSQSISMLPSDASIAQLGVLVYEMPEK